MRLYRGRASQGRTYSPQPGCLTRRVGAPDGVVSCRTIPVPRDAGKARLVRVKGGPSILVEKHKRAGAGRKPDSYMHAAHGASCMPEENCDGNHTRDNCTAKRFLMSTCSKMRLEMRTTDEDAAIGEGDRSTRRHRADRRSMLFPTPPPGRSVGSDEARLVRGGSASARGVWPDCQVTSNCSGWWFEWGPLHCVTCPSVDNQRHTIGPAFPVTHEKSCPNGTMAGVCRPAGGSCQRVGPIATVPCGVYTRYEVEAAYPG